DLYFGCNKYLYKINKDGKLIWKYKFDEHIENIVSPILGSNGEIYLPVQSKLAAISNEGKLLWKKSSFRVSTLCSPVLDNRENIYLMNKSGFLYSLKCSGRKNWEIHFSGVEFGNEVKNSILNIGRKGALYFGTKDGAFIAVETGSTGLGQTDWPVYGRNCQNTSNIIE
ncbi:MAG: PQQ-like beta-propeller repeat protein, partial [Kosmotoga sp.]